MDLVARAHNVLKSAHVVSLATKDEGGIWVADLIFVSNSDFVLYWMSSPESRHGKAIHRDPTVAGTVTVSTSGLEQPLGIQFEGRARKLEGARNDLARLYFTKRGVPVPEETAEYMNGHAWYEAVLTKVRLVDAANFGFETKDVPL